MQGLAEEFVRRREALREQGGGFRVPEELREVAVRFTHWAFEAGESLGSAAAELEVSRATLERWLAKEPAAAPALREVVIADAEADLELSCGDSRLALVTPAGYRIEGLALGEVVEVLRALA